jgi:photosystem II stability/assembly factor-like uncharacterized protein
MLLMVGTVKGLIRFQSDDRRRFKPLSPALTGEPVYHSAYDAESRTLYAAVNSDFYGPSVRRSHDFGETWDTGGQGLQYDEDDAERVTRVWSIRPAGQGVLYAGVEASGLFRSEDGGDTWHEIRALREHPTHATWGEGAGGKCLHTVLVDPFDGRRLYTACSTGGVYRSDDGGASWRPSNRNIRAEHVPEDLLYPEAGQCVHKIAFSPTRPGRLWARSHSGVYRSDDGGDTWEAIDATLPSDFGFPLVTHPRDPERAFVIPLASDGERWFPGQQAAVYRTDDGGRVWRPLSEGLPGGAFSVVLRDAFSGDGESPQGLYFGTTSGSVYASADEGEVWTTVAQELPRVLSVAVVAQ